MSPNATPLTLLFSGVTPTTGSALKPEDRVLGSYGLLGAAMTRVSQKLAYYESVIQNYSPEAKAEAQESINDLVLGMGPCRALISGKIGTGSSLDEALLEAMMDSELPENIAAIAEMLWSLRDVGANPSVPLSAVTEEKSHSQEGSALRL